MDFKDAATKSYYQKGKVLSSMGDIPDATDMLQI